MVWRIVAARNDRAKAVLEARQRFYSHPSCAKVVPKGGVHVTRRGAVWTVDGGYTAV